MGINVFPPLNKDMKTSANGSCQSGETFLVATGVCGGESQTVCVCNELYSDAISLIMIKTKIQKFLDDMRVKM